MIGDRWAKLKLLNELRQSEAITQAEFDDQKAKLLASRTLPRWKLPRPDVSSPGFWLALGIPSLLIVMLIAVGVNSERSADLTAASDAAAAASDAAVAAADANAAFSGLSDEPTPAPLPKVDADQVATAFATLYGRDATEEARGSQVVFQPAGMIPVAETSVALVSLGKRDGGSDGLACHACPGLLRVDYLQWDGAKYVPADPPVRFNEAGNGFGEPPRWKFIRSGKLPAIRVSTTYMGQGCVVDTVTILKLTRSGVARMGDSRREDCSAASLDGGSDAGAAEDAAAAAADARAASADAGLPPPPQ